MREEEKKQPSQKFFRKRWVYPAVYLASAAIIITAILWYQSVDNNNVADESKDYGYAEPTENSFDRPAVEVNRSLENFKMPVQDAEAAVIVKNFYDETASAQEQEEALLVYNNTYQPNTGIDVAMDGKDFDVVASLSGEVTKVQEDPLLGNVIEIEHAEGITTRYSSVKDFAVKVGDQVDQGQTIAKAGQSQMNQEAGTHVHFEIRKDDVAVNPNDYINKSMLTLKGADLKKQHDEDAEDKNVIGESESTDDTQADEETNSSADEESTSNADQAKPNADQNTEDTSDQE